MSPNDDFPHEEEAKGAEDWAANEPPVDDFGDPAAEAATVSEGVEAAHEESAAGVGVVEEKKKAPVALLLVFVFGLAAAGAVAYWQFGMKPPDVTAEVPPSGSTMALNLKPEAPSAAVPAAAPAADPSAAAPTSNFGASPQPAPQAAAAAAPAPSAPQPAAPSNSPVAMAPAPSSGASDTRLNELATRISDLEKSVGQTTQQLSQLNDKLAAAPTPASPTPAQPDTATTDRIEKLEQKVMQLEQHESAPSYASSSSSSSSSSSMPLHMASHATRHHEHHYEHVASMGSTKKAKSSGRWVLRAATADEVWVAKSSSTREIRPVHVGDTLAGIGTVTSIEQDGDAWVVKGTAGTVR